MRPSPALKKEPGAAENSHRATNLHSVEKTYSSGKRKAKVKIEGQPLDWPCDIVGDRQLREAWSIQAARLADSTAALRLIPLLVSLINLEKHCAWPSDETLAEKVGKSVASVRKGLSHLKRCGLLITDDNPARDRNGKWKSARTITLALPVEVAKKMDPTDDITSYHRKPTDDTTWCHHRRYHVISTNPDRTLMKGLEGEGGVSADLHLERSLIGFALLDQTAFDEITWWPEIFAAPRHRRIVEAMDRTQNRWPDVFLEEIDPDPDDGTEIEMYVAACLHETREMVTVFGNDWRGLLKKLQSLRT